LGGSPEPAFLADEIEDLIDRYNRLHYILSEGRLDETARIESLSIADWHTWRELWTWRHHGKG